MPSARSGARSRRAVSPARSKRAAAWLFVYGTLMRGEPLYPVLRNVARFEGEGRARGTLVSFGDYPGLLDGDGWVRGEVYVLDDPDLLPIVDREEEEYNFVRRRTGVDMIDGRRVRAWVYRYSGPRASSTLIPGGDWRNRCR